MHVWQRALLPSRDDGGVEQEEEDEVIWSPIYKKIEMEMFDVQLSDPNLM